jgi:hypothetical protein
MNQPQNPVPPRGARPQLFNAPASTTVNAKRQPDFGPSILATIDGGQARFARSRGLPGKGLLIVGALALMGAAAYLGVKFSGSRSASDIPMAAAPVLKAVEAAPPASQPVAVAQGAAAIETVTPPVAAPASEAAASQPITVAASLNNIQQALDRSEPAPAKKEVVAVKEAQAPRRAPSTVSAKPSAKPTLDDDADLLAAMLPHLKRTAATPTSPAYEKRCGQLASEAAADCRAKFCSGKQGTDPACPAPRK